MHLKTFNSNEIAELFGSFNFTGETKVTIDSPKLERIKVFNQSNNQWKGLSEPIKFIINNLGQINKIYHKTDLQEVFKNFQFTDDKGVKNFLDTNSLTNITNQIIKHLGLNNLSEAKLSLKNLTSNSVTLVAASDSEKYQGQITLTWNLKLFEIYGSPVTAIDIDNKWIEKGLTGYFYLESQTNQIKYFEVLEYFYPGSVAPLYPGYDDYHKFNFKNENNEEKQFIFNGKEWRDEIAERFGYFTFTDKTKVLVESPDLNRVKIFDSLSNEWKGLTQKSEFIINKLGQITKISN